MCKNAHGRWPRAKTTAQPIPGRAIAIATATVLLLIGRRRGHTPRWPTSRMTWGECERHHEYGTHVADDCWLGGTQELRLGRAADSGCARGGGCRAFLRAGQR